jgi:hypothetical protein
MLRRLKAKPQKSLGSRRKPLRSHSHEHCGLRTGRSLHKVAHQSGFSVIAAPEGHQGTTQVAAGERRRVHGRMFIWSTTAASAAAVSGGIPNLPGSGTATKPCMTPDSAGSHLMPA